MKLLWRQGLVAGMDQATNPNLVNDNEGQLLKNISLDQPGSWSTRPGQALIADAISAANGVKGLFAYVKDDDTFTLYSIINRSLYPYNETTSNWDSPIAANKWPANTRVDAVNFLNRLYIGSEDGDTPLCWTDGVGINDVTPKIGGSQIAVNKNSIAVAGNKHLPNVIFFSKPFTDTFEHSSGVCTSNADSEGVNTVTATTQMFEPGYIGSILYNTTKDEMVTITGWRSGATVEINGDAAGWDDDTIYVLKNNFRTDNKVKGLIGYGEYFIAWDENKMYCWDPTQQPNGWSIEYKAGCSDYRSVGVVDDIVIFANRNALMLYSGQGRPIDITSKIRNKISHNGIWDLLDGANWGKMASGVVPGEGVYKLSVGTLKTKLDALASATPNVEIVFDLKKTSGFVHSRPQKPTCYTNFVNKDGILDLYFGEDGTGAVYKEGVGVVDINSTDSPIAIPFEIVTQDHRLSNPRVMTRLHEIPIQYTSSSPVSVDISANRGPFIQLGVLPISEKINVMTLLPPSGNIDGFSYRLKFKNQNTGPVSSLLVGEIDGLIVSGEYTGDTVKEYVVEVDGANTFKWSKDNGETWQVTEVVITGSSQVLEDGISITFNPISGYETGDRWMFEAGPTKFVLEGYGMLYTDLGTLTHPSL